MRRWEIGRSLGQGDEGLFCPGGPKKTGLGAGRPNSTGRLGGPGSAGGAPEAAGAPLSAPPLPSHPYGLSRGRNYHIYICRAGTDNKSLGAVLAQVHHPCCVSSMSPCCLIMWSGGRHFGGSETTQISNLNFEDKSDTTPI